MIVGIDTGGTFTDFAVWDGSVLRVHKELSTPARPEIAILRGLVALGLSGLECRIVHGSTVATNALLEGKGARTLFITNRGFADTLVIGRQARAQLYDLTPRRPAPLIAPELCLETGGRIGPDGSILEPLSAADLAALEQAVRERRPEAIAISLLFSFVDDTHERRIEAALDGLAFISRSSEVLPEYREYERGLATWLNAYVGPLMHDYLSVLESRLKSAEVSIMQSSGVTCEAKFAATHAVNLLLSGPAGGLAGAQYIGRQCGREQLLTIDMGGTSTDVALIDGQVGMTSEGMLGRLPVGVPMVDLHTIGAGGGSIAVVDAGGVLHVGPQSAGADPGPACYGAGGLSPTVTDANVVLGRLPADIRLGGSLTLDRGAAVAALMPLVQKLGVATVEAVARGIIDVVNEHMSAALRVISVERGVDPRCYTLVSFGGAGGLHVCALAQALGMASALIPAQAGVLSAFGMIVARPGRRLSRTIRRVLSELSQSQLQVDLEQMAAPGIAALIAEGHARDAITSSASVDLCYRGQSYPINVPWVTSSSALEASFHLAHTRRYGHVLDRPLELINLRVALDADNSPLAVAGITPPSAPTGGDPKPYYRREELRADVPLYGPAIVLDDCQTAFIDAGWRCQLDASGNLMLELL